MKASISPVLVEAYVLLEFLTMLLTVILVPLMGLTPLNLSAMVISLVLTVIIAFGYALFAIAHQPPIGSRLLKLFKRGEARR